MSGKPASVSVWIVNYTFNKPPRAVKVPKTVKKKDKDQDKVGPNTVVICSADPSGSDNYRIAKLLVLGEKPYEGNDFTVVHMQRFADAMGYAKIETVAAIAGKAPEETGIVETEEEDEGGGGDGGSIPPGAELN